MFIGGDLLDDLLHLTLSLKHIKQIRAARSADSKQNKREVQEQMHKILPEHFPTGKYFIKG